MPRPANSGGGDIPPADIYKVAVEEYRFQAQFNWQRTQYLLVLNAGVLAAGAAVTANAKRPGIASVVFGFGILAAVLAVLAIRQQRDYYRAARNRMRRIEADYLIPPDHRTDTTTSLGGRTRFASVNQLVFMLFAGIAVADVAGIFVALTR
jgi:hypothetical protein